MGGEFRRKGVNVLLGPMVGPAWRVVRGGRNWEGFSADPYLSGSLVAQTIQGVQSQGVQTSLKVQNNEFEAGKGFLTDHIASITLPTNKR